MVKDIMNILIFNQNFMTDAILWLTYVFLIKVLKGVMNINPKILLKF